MCARALEPVGKAMSAPSSQMLYMDAVFVHFKKNCASLMEQRESPAVTLAAKSLWKVPAWAVRTVLRASGAPRMVMTIMLSNMEDVGMRWSQWMQKAKGVRRMCKKGTQWIKFLGSRQLHVRNHQYDIHIALMLVTDSAFVQILVFYIFISLYYLMLNY